MTKQISRFVNGIILLASVIILIPSTAAAEEYFAYPGVSCKFYGPQSEDDYISPKGHKAIGLENTSNRTKLVVCPIARKNGASMWLDVRIEEVEYTDSPSCGLYTADPFFSDGYNYYNLENIGITGDMTVFTTPDLVDTGPFASLFCYLPPGAIMRGYVTNYN